MTKEQQRIAIAEACGWKQPYPEIEWKWHDPNGRMHENWGGELSCPDYLNDLNAMQSAINQQSVDFQEEFDTTLRSLNGHIHQATSTQWAEIFIDIALRKEIIKP